MLDKELESLLAKMSNDSKGHRQAFESSKKKYFKPLRIKTATWIGNSA